LTVTGAFVVLQVQDMGRAVAFWRDAMGLPSRLETRGFAELDAGSTVLALQLGGGAEPRRTALGLDVDDLDACCTAIALGGGRVLRAPEDSATPGLRVATAEDTEGNGFLLTEHRPPQG
jgi:predicted enzyme related to lactoylglutathione lyase